MHEIGNQSDMGSNTGQACTLVWLALGKIVGLEKSACCPTDVVEYAERWANEGKIVIIAALDGTFQRQPFRSILELIPLAEEVCSCCSSAKVLVVSNNFAACGHPRYWGTALITSGTGGLSWGLVHMRTCKG